MILKVLPSLFGKVKIISDDSNSEHYRVGDDADYRLEAITDWIFNIDGPSDISIIVRDYFNENGYILFKVPDSNQEEEEDD